MTDQAQAPEITQPPGTHLAQFNIARMVDEITGVDSPRLADFVDALDQVNAVAERSAGFVWRLKDDTGNATDIAFDGDPRMIVNMSVWEGPEPLENFVWNTVHKRVYDKKANWFETPANAHFVMWWIQTGHIPTLDEARARLAELDANGPTENAFGWESLPHIRLWMSQRCA